ncbi:hypothetical protein [Nocardiopsis salina]|uniref:hypothetical protein n=1 Tax=Nocardiopsis salina TaxID=245836 RepID=UPI0003481BEA|nr:hypothetical protein [Nocardiopsis salina]
MSTATTEHLSLDLNVVTDRVLTTTGHEPGATLISHSPAQGPGWTLVDHGNSPPEVAEYLHQCSLQGRPASSVVLMHARADITWQEWIPEHVTALMPAQASAGGTPLPHVPRARAYQVAPDRAIVALGDDETVIAGDLMAPHLPDLSHTSPRRALEGLMYTSAQAPMVLIGSRGCILSAHAQVATDGPVPTEHLATVAEVRMRESYLRAIITTAQHAVGAGLSPRQAASQTWEWLAWRQPRDQNHARAYTRRHLVNLHAAMAAEQGRQLDLSQAQADAAAL